ncbi:MAG TPA: long-chain fatty acid--CoA ligase [Planctomycetota bacterium]|nr:long-chain fatty acid--CoA ligase [Planctomycetota bacterium]
MRTLADLFRKGLDAGRGRNRILFPTRDGYRPLTGEEVESRVHRAASAMAARGIKPGDRVALISYNRPEWAIAEYAAQLIGAVTVPLYATSTAEQAGFILSDSGSKLVFAENAEQLAKIGPGRDAVVFEPAPGATTFESFLASGTGSPPTVDPDPAAVATIIYTSGTTGMPKGVMLSHKNLVSDAIALLEIVTFTPEDVSLSFLPVSHAFQRIVDYAIFLRGATVAYAESVDSVAKNLLEVRPTILCAVPRFYEKVYDRAMQSIDAMPGSRKKLAHWALRVGREEMERRIRSRGVPFGLALRRGVANFLVLRKIRAKTGGRIRLLVSGGAPLGFETNAFFNSLGFTLIEGYGLTETSPVITLNRPGAVKIGTVGQAIAGVEVRIAPEDGEILCRGPIVMMGYFNRPDETAQVMTDGWFKTGDIGELDAEGYLKITDRKKDLLKTSGGKYIAPAPIETRIREHPYVANALLIGDRRKFAAALLVPDFGVLEREYPGVGRAALTTHPPVLAAIQGHVDSINATLSPWETVKRFALLEEDFTIQGGELTPTMKIKRKVVEEKRKETIEKLYR